jgi:hypothetical protein
MLNLQQGQMIYYSEDLFKDFLESYKFYKTNYNTIEELDNNYNFVRNVFHDIIPLINKQHVIYAPDYNILYEHVRNYGILEHYFRRLIFSLMEFFKNNIDVTASQCTFVDFYRCLNL